MSLVDGETRIHLDTGGFEDYNHKLINQAILGHIYHDFIPQLVLPNREVMAQIPRGESYPVVEIQGETLSEHYERLQLSFSDLLRVVLEYYRQQYLMLEKSGVMLRDRKADNMILQDTQSKIPQDSGTGDETLHLWQVDLDFVFDEVDGVWLESSHSDLNQRKAEDVVFIDSLDTYKKLAHELAFILRLFDPGLRPLEPTDHQKYISFKTYLKKEFEYGRGDWAAAETTLAQLTPEQGTKWVLDKLKNLISFSEELLGLVPNS